jgi:hypothetical protein
MLNSPGIESLPPYIYNNMTRGEKTSKSNDLDFNWVFATFYLYVKSFHMAYQGFLMFKKQTNQKQIPLYAILPCFIDSQVHGGILKFKWTR